jgi:succinate dehydrogenase / fumarate reductase iron-sulfur subunit
MVINGKVRQSCSTPVEGLNQPITVEPMGTFPVLRDLQVDRSSMFKSLEDVRAWAELDGLHDQAVSLFKSPIAQRRIFALSSCMMCGCCLEACPQVNDRSPYHGAFLINSVMLISERHPLSSLVTGRWNALKGPGGVASCGNAHNCELACPKGVPLVATIARARWNVMKHSVLSFLKR